MKLTPFGKLFLALVVLSVIGFVVFNRYGDKIKTWAGADKAAVNETLTKDDFGELTGKVDEPPRDGKIDLNNATKVETGGGKLNRPLKVAINTWAGHAPGIVAN